VLRGEPLDRERDDLAGILLRLAFGLLTDFAPQRLGFAPCLVFRPLEQLTPCLLGRESRDALEPSLLLPDQGGGLGVAACPFAASR
jgi:hypothetical protein